LPCSKHGQHHIQPTPRVKKHHFLVLPDSPVPGHSGHLRVSGREIKNSFANAPQFDVIIIPGSFSANTLPEAAASFLDAQCSSPDLHAIFSISSGILHLAQSGLLWQRRASAPRCLISMLQQRFPDTYWQTKAWNRHDKIWTSSTAVSALDMIASWMREYFWDRHEAVECALATAGIGSLDEFDY